MVDGDMELNPEQMAAFMEQMEKKNGNQFASIKAGLWMTNGRADTIRYYIDPQISKFYSLAFSMFSTVSLPSQHMTLERRCMDVITTSKR